MSTRTPGPPGFPWFLPLNVYGGTWKGPRGLLDTAARFPKDVAPAPAREWGHGSEAPRTRLAAREVAL